MKNSINFILLIILISSFACKNYKYKQTSNTNLEKTKELKKQKNDSINNRIIEKSLIIEKVINEHFNFIEQNPSLPPPEIGEKYYDFRGVNEIGELMKISDIEGKNILLNFTATRCGPCLKSIPELKRIYEKHQESLEIINFYYDFQVYDCLELIEKRKISWITLWDGKGCNSETWGNYGINGTPTFYLINSKGIVIKKWIGYMHGFLEEQIDNLEKN